MSILQKDSTLKAQLVLISITILWAGTFTLVKSALESVSSLMFLAVRFTLASLVYYPFVHNRLHQVNRHTFIGGGVVGLFFFMGFAFQTIGLETTTATKSAFITGTFIVFTPLFQTILEQRIPRWANLVGIFIVFIGILMMSAGEGSPLQILKEIGTDFTIGDFFTLICAVSYAIYLVYLDIYSHEIDYRVMTFAQISFSAVASILLTLLFHFSEWQVIRFELTTEAFFAFLYTGIVASIVATMLQTKFQRFVTPTKAAILFSMEPIFAAVISYFYLGEVLTTAGFIGCAVIFSGLMISEFVKE
ncbi:hypothetical protein BAC3_01414 [uncultured bacterium]|nr:hypothetical protein BAC3_01414 [uncultured bacterium]